MVASLQDQGLMMKIAAAPRISVRLAEVSVGRPLLWSVYDVEGNLLLKSGFVVESQEQIEKLAQNGFFRDQHAGDSCSDAAPNPAAAAAAAPEPVRETVVGMDDVRWNIGEPLYLQPHDNHSLRYAVRLIGFVKNKTVMVTAPTLDGKFGFIRDGQTFTVRSFSGKKAHVFMAAAVKTVHSPFPYLHLSYPQEVRATVIRKGSRTAVKLIAAISLGQPVRSIATTLTDLSVAGASGTARQAFGTKGELGLIKFKLQVADHTAILNLEVALRSVTLSDSGDVYHHGFEFLHVPVEQRMMLSAYVHQALAGVD
jgi:c-di-GMP-binding flagellar brake protein YcgR